MTAGRVLAPGVTEDDRGSVTIEAALGISALSLVMAMCLAGIGCGITQIRCADAAREAARMAGRGDDPAVAVAAIAPSGASLQLDAAGDVVIATVSAPAIGGLLPEVRISARAVAAKEESVGG